MLSAVSLGMFTWQRGKTNNEGISSGFNDDFPLGGGGGLKTFTTTFLKGLHI